jgi:hypothetical protein
MSNFGLYFFWSFNINLLALTFLSKQDLITFWIQNFIIVDHNETFLERIVDHTIKSRSEFVCAKPRN